MDFTTLKNKQMLLHKKLSLIDIIEYSDNNNIPVNDIDINEVYGRYSYYHYYCGNKGYQLCNNKFCLICNQNKINKIKKKYIPFINKLLKENPDSRYFFITLKLNSNRKQVEELRNNISFLQDSRKKLFENKEIKEKYISCHWGLDIRYKNNKTITPHLHMLVVSKDNNILSPEMWELLWLSATGENTPTPDIQELKETENKPLTNHIIDSCFTYPLKIEKQYEDILRLSADNLKLILEELKGIRFYGNSGTIRNLSIKKKEKTGLDIFDKKKRKSPLTQLKELEDTDNRKEVIKARRKKRRKQNKKKENKTQGEVQNGKRLFYFQKTG